MLGTLGMIRCESMNVQDPFLFQANTDNFVLMGIHNFLLKSVRSRVMICKMNSVKIIVSFIHSLVT